MKVILFCGGLGMRIRDAEDIPKPMVHIGQRPILWHVMKYYAHYGLTDLPLGQQIDHFHEQNKIASFLCIRPNLSYHTVSVARGNGSLVSDIHPITNGDLRINGGFFIFKKQIFDYIREKEELVIEPFQRLVKEKQLIGYTYDGFWESMDTFKDRQHLESLASSGLAPWEVWKNNGSV